MLPQPTKRKSTQYPILDEELPGESGLAGIKRAARIVGGFIMVAAGVAGWLLPIIPGWALFIPGLILLSREFHWARRLLQWFRSRFRAARSSYGENPPGD